MRIDRSELYLLVLRTGDLSFVLTATRGQIFPHQDFPVDEEVIVQNTGGKREQERVFLLLVLWIVGLVLFYTLFGFVILPLVVKHVAIKQLSKELDREVTIRTVRINPYVLSGTIRGLLVKDKDRVVDEVRMRDVSHNPYARST
jgi:hypothetical protein